MNFRGGFSIPQGEEIHLESSWTPATPEKPPILMRSNSVLENPNENQVLDLVNSLEPAPNYNFLAQTFNTNPQVGRLPVRFGYDGNPNINGIGGSYQQHSLLDESEDWNNISFMQLLQQGGNSDLVASTNRTLSKDVQVSAEQPLMPTLPPEMSNFRRDCSSSDGFNSESSFRPEIASARCQVGKSWIGSNPAGVLLREGTQCSASDPADNGTAHPRDSDAFRIPSRPSYDSNSSLSINCDALTNAANSLVFTPVTPDQAANLEKQSSAVLMSTAVESTSQEKDRLGNLVQYMGKEANQHGEELLQNIGDSSSTTISTALKELTDSDKKIDLGIDLNKTPQQKPPKRKKHRPKVIVEGKPRRARKPAQPKNTPSGENLPEKRKYVRKNARKDLTAQEVDITRETRDPGIGTGQKTCKRVLNFDLEKTGNETHNNVAAQQEVQNMNIGTKSIIGDYQAMERLNGTNHALGTSQVQSGLPKSLMVENQTPGKMDSGAHFMSQMSPDGLAIVAPLASTQDMPSKHFYVTGKPEINSNADQWKNRMADKYALMQQETDGEGAGQDGLQGKADNGNLDRAKQMINLETIKLMIQQQTYGKGAGQNGLQVKADKGNLERAKQMMNLERIKLMTQQQTHGEGAGQDGLQVKADKENLERAKRMMNLERIKLMTQQQTHGLQLKADKGNLERAKQMMNRERIKLMMQQQTHGEGAGQEGLQGKANNGNLERAKQMINLERIKLMMQIMPQQASMTPSKFYEARGSKREHSQTTEHANQSTTNHVGSSLYDETFQVDECQRNGHTLLTEFPQTHKKNKIGGDYRDIQNTPSSGKGADGGLGKAEIKRAHDAYPIGQTSRLNCTTLNSYLESSRVMDRENKQGNKFTNDRYVYPMASGQNSLNQKISSRIHSHIERTSSTRGLNPVKSFSAQATIENCNHRIHIPSLKERSTGPGIGQTFQTCYNSMSEKRQTVGAPLLKSASLRAEKLQEPSPKIRGPKTKQIPISMDEILYRLQRLNLNGSSNGLQKQDQNALVLYKGDGAVVPYDGLEFLKKRKPRPKVDLDPETNRIWNLLMGKEGSEDLGGTDKEKEKRWEEERKVFRGRVDSFIARMHLVQGDRRFSPWKGSVVDSVIGVFLTQNVSDHLSSSAFMSLAARFPIKFRSYRAQDKAETNMIDRQAPILMLNPDDTYKWREELSEPINNPNIRPHESAENQWESDNRGTKRSLIEAQSQSSDEEFMLSQDSFDSTITQVTGGIRSCSGSNSETEDPCTSCKPSNIQLSSSTHYLQLEKMTSVQKVFSHVNGCTILNEKSKHGLVEYGQLKSRSDAMKHLDFPSNNPDYPYMQQAGHSESNKLHIINDSRVPQIWCYETLSEESTSSWHSTASRSAKGLEAVSKSSRTGESAGNFGISTNKLNGECRSQETPTADPYALLSMFLTNEQGNGIPQTVPHIGHNHQTASGSYQPERNNIFHLKGPSSTEPVQLAEAHTKMQNATMESVPKFNNLTEKTFEAGDSISAVRMQMHKENRLAEPNLKKQTSSNYASEAANTKMSKAQKGNSKSQKKNEVNWDKLRKKVESDGKKGERGNDAMDSIDYEAVRNANVNEISDAIKERGMNNMLAERIQEFLNRLVREHGSIDLEWLRDVPPDQAKDYLLSIRGIGLKSVECVRLLTLHHLAFPVDTNVGRIAVRLGWVPLQPLPESLQLHLLELYPMLESIQKYLWPRLCKLDQRTLYQLHYQMITFGKVFCTKREPNCNACPMRGECRHFASAFASARLALPGPEERGIVGSTVPIPTEKPPTVVIHPMTLPLPENDLVKEGGSRTGNCEPIIEEPTTPELECTEISQSDIEDAFYEDPDEIPTIKLNMEEFTENLQTYMQKNMELQEGDMSKALVALTPDVASIPIPKLKNVSRLRTEHQVYELPDSHPLLERLDRRETDDPSPYLLAIWTPGETANSILPSERSCGSQEPGKLCNDETCFSCNSMREANSRTVRGTILIPCRTAMRGSFPLNGTYFQVNEVFADHDSSLNPIDVPREWIWNLPRRTVYFGTSVTTIFKGLSTEGIQYCFWKGFVCVRGFDLTTRAPRPLMARLHFPASKLAKAKNDDKR